ncbi:hypothetical protein HMSSN036_64100 [Paenibacillus macerans]|nr:hypothetical protein HMSSN036_64100 [Paenibacillus macerans]
MRRNTMAAVKLAMEQPEVHWIEVDVQLSKDGVPLLIHDFTLNRTTSGSGPVKDKTWAELQELDAGSWKSQAYAGERLLSLSEFLDAIAGRLRANIEIKTEGNRYPGLEEKVIPPSSGGIWSRRLCLPPSNLACWRKSEKSAAASAPV